MSAGNTSQPCTAKAINGEVDQSAQTCCSKNSTKSNGQEATGPMKKQDSCASEKGSKSGGCGKPKSNEKSGGCAGKEPSKPSGGCCKPKPNEKSGGCAGKESSKSSDGCCSSSKSNASESCSAVSMPNKQTNKSSAPAISGDFVQELQMEIGGMTCAGCCSRIEQYLSNENGIELVEVTLLTEKAKVMYDTRKISIDKIMDEVTRLGFTPSQVLKADGDSCNVRFVVPKDAVDDAMEFLNTISTSGSDSEVVGSDGIIGAMQKKSDSISQSGKRESVISISFNPEVVSAMEILTMLRTHVNSKAFLMPLKEQRSVAASAKKSLLKIRKELTMSAIFTFPVLIIKYVLPMFSDVGTGLSWLDFITLVCATVVQFIGKPIFESAYSSIRYNMRANMDVLIALSTTLSYGVSLISLAFYVIMGSSSPLLEDSGSVSGEDERPIMFFETSTLLITLILLGRLGEKSAKSSAFCSVEALVDLQPDAATVVDTAQDGSKQERVVEIGLVRRGDILKVYSGNRIPTDGNLITGSTSVDESMITGESAAVKKVQGSLVLGGTSNLHGTFEMRVSRTVYESTLSQILHLVEEAQQEKPERQRIADVIASYFTLAIIILACSVFVFWYVWGSRMGVGNDHVSPFIKSLKFAITTLVISCPCAISLAVPTAVLVATGRGASSGVLFKGGGVMEKMHSTDVVVFDKTGTLTRGKPRVTECVIFPKSGGTNEDKSSEILEIAAELERNSNHPIAEAIVDSVQKRDSSNFDVTDFSVEPGRGIRGIMKSKVDTQSMVVELGSLSWFKEMGYEEAVASCDKSKTFWENYEMSQNSGYILICMAIDHHVQAYIKLQDSPRPEAPQLVRELAESGRQVWMITGDQRGTASAIARSIGISESCVIAGVKPEDKMTEVSKLQEKGHVVTFVGDGVNDAPALTRADVGVAIGSGTDVAVESADVVLVHPSLLNLLNAIDLSDTTVRRITYNFGWAFLYNIVMMPIASGMLYAITQSSWFQIPPSLAGLSELLSSVPVILFSLLLNTWSPKYQLEDERAGQLNSYGATDQMITRQSSTTRNGTADERTKLL